MRRLPPILAVLALLILAAPAGAASSTLVVNEIDYDQPSTDTAEFVELRNVAPTAVDLDAYTLQLVNGSTGAAYLTFDLPAVALAPGEHYVVCASAATVANCDLDVTPETNLIQNGDPDAVAVSLGGTVVDAVSYEGQVPGFAEGAEGAPSDSADAGQSLARVPDGCDTDENGADFRVAAATPGATNGEGPCGGPGDAAPAVLATSPADDASGVATDATLSVTFSEPVTVDDGGFALTCTNGATIALAAASTDGTTFTLEPATELPRARCTLTVRAAAVRDADADDPPDAMAADATAAFSVAGLAGLRIHDVQGRQHRSAYAGSTVSAVPGVVTAVGPAGFWMQDARPDRDERTSEGIFVFRGGRPAVGTPVLVDGLVEEFRPGGDANNLTTTELSFPVVTPGGSGTVAPTLIGRGGRRPPLRFIDNDSAGDVELNPVFDPWQDGIDFHESLEGMLVEIRKPTVVGPTNSFDELPVVADGAAEPRTERDGVIVRPNDFNPERIILDDVIADPPDANVGDGLAGPVRAVVDYGFANYKYLLTAAPARIDRGLPREVTRAPRPDELAVGSMNVENLTFVDADEAKFERLARILVENMRSPDIVAVEEVQDNDGAANTAVTGATLTWQRFIDTVAEVGGPSYAFRQIDPADDQDGGQPGGNIRVGFLFRTDRGLTFVDRPGGTATNATAVVEGASGPELTFSPGRLDPGDPAFTDSRKPLAGEFRWRGETVIAVANHFNSKGGDQPLFGRFQPPERVTELQRHAQAGVVRAFVEQALDVDRRAHVVVMGDLNDFEFSRTLDIIEDAPMVNLMETLDRDERYSYVFEGNSQTLDQILVTRSLRDGAAYDSVHVNAEFYDQASDHDPQVARLDVD
jgi:predicted extracellular nuclease